jgi:hypothetical protein
VRFDSQPHYNIRAGRDRTIREYLISFIRDFALKLSQTSSADESELLSSQGLRLCDRYGTADNFQFGTLIKERSRQETEEAKSAVTARFRKAAAADIVSTESRTRASGLDVLASTGLDSASGTSTEIKASLISAITRVMSASLTSAAPSTVSGADRRLRWKQAGISLDDQDDPDGLQDLTPKKSESTAKGRAVRDLSYTALCKMEKTAVKALGRTLYKMLDKQLKLDMVSAGLSVFHPLKQGSWVVVCSHGKLHFGLGEFASRILSRSRHNGLILHLHYSSSYLRERRRRQTHSQLLQDLRRNFQAFPFGRAHLRAFRRAVLVTSNCHHARRLSGGHVPLPQRTRLARRP